MRIRLGHKRRGRGYGCVTVAEEIVRTPSTELRVLPDTLVLPPYTLSGSGSALGLTDKCRMFGQRGVLVHGTSLLRSGLLAHIAGDMTDRSLMYWRHPGGEPTLDQLEELLTAARGHGAHWVAAIGGGSVMDLAKACAGLLEAPHSAEAYHEGLPVTASRIPFIAAPTTAGTGSESTIVTVLTNSQKGLKRSIRHPSFIARLVVLDPDLLSSCPARVIANSGMDAFTQAVEAYLSIKATWFSDQQALKAVELINASVEQVYDGGGNASSRQDLLQGSYLAGLALSNARLGVVHGLAHPLGVRYHQPHGLVCAVCLPPVLEFNRGSVGAKFDRLAACVSQDVAARARELLVRLGITSPFRGAALRDEKGIVAETLASGSTAANPRPVTDVDVSGLLAQIFTG